MLEEEIDPKYEPTEKEVLEYATWLGMDVDTERDLLWIARKGLKAPLPENWKPCTTVDTEEIYYFNFATGQSTWDHPCDEYYRNLFEEHKKEHQRKQAQLQETEDKKVDNRELLRKGEQGSAAAPELTGSSLLWKKLTQYSTVSREVEPNDKWFIPRHDIHLGDVRFKVGSYGLTCRGKYMNADVVVKSKSLASESHRDQFLREVNIWYEANHHPNIVPRYGACHAGGPCFMVAKYIAGGTLKDYLHRFQEDEKLRRLKEELPMDSSICIAKKSFTVF